MFIRWTEARSDERIIIIILRILTLLKKNDSIFKLYSVSEWFEEKMKFSMRLITLAIR